MNYTGDLSYADKKARDEISRVLDSTDIGKDDIFELTGTDTISISFFNINRRGFYRVPCSVCNVYVRKITRIDGQLIYELAYQSTVFIDGKIIPPFYRIIYLKRKAPVMTFMYDNIVHIEHTVQSQRTWTAWTSTGQQFRFTTASIPDETQTSAEVTSSGTTRNYSGCCMYWH